jgi:hypothetical protein
MTETNKYTSLYPDQAYQLSRGQPVLSRKFTIAHSQGIYKRKGIIVHLLHNHRPRLPARGYIIDIW